MKSYLLVLGLLVALSLGATQAAITVTNINTTLVLNTNSSARVTEVLTVSISNQSIAQYTADRLSLNFTLAQWQNLIGPSIVEHIINPKGATLDFHFLPGPVNDSQNGKVAYLLLSYLVTNVTKFNETGPRTFLYQFNNNVFNFQHIESGQLLGDNTTLTIILPSSSKIVSVYPLPDYPSVIFDQGYANVTKLSWFADEPLSKFALTFTVQQSLGQEVTSFFSYLYTYYGALIIVVVVGAVAFFLAYTYMKTSK